MKIFSLTTWLFCYYHYLHFPSFSIIEKDGLWTMIHSPQSLLSDRVGQLFHHHCFSPSYQQLSSVTCQSLNLTYILSPLPCLSFSLCSLTHLLFSFSFVFSRPLHSFHLHPVAQQHQRKSLLNWDLTEKVWRSNFWFGKKFTVFFLIQLSRFIQDWNQHYRYAGFCLVKKQSN